jgi:hypothetical protein
MLMPITAKETPAQILVIWQEFVLFSGILRLSVYIFIKRKQMHEKTPEYFLSAMAGRRAG